MHVAPLPDSAGDCRRQTLLRIAAVLRCSTQTVCNTIHAFEKKGVACLPKGSLVPVTVQPVLNVEKRECLRANLHQTPRNFVKSSNRWTLKLLAEVCHDQGLSNTELSGPTIRFDCATRRDLKTCQALDCQFRSVLRAQKTAGSAGSGVRKAFGHRAGFRG